MAAMIAGKPVEGLGIDDRVEQEEMVLYKEGVNQGVALSTSFDQSSCLNKFWASSESYNNIGHL